MIVRYNWWQCLLSSNVGHVGFQKYNWLNRYVLDINFWHNVTLCIKAKYPLIKVFWLVDSDEKPAKGFINKAIDQVKKERYKWIFVLWKKGVISNYLVNRMSWCMMVISLLYYVI